jgi:hypothetical protein
MEEVATSIPKARTNIQLGNKRVPVSLRHGSFAIRCRTPQKQADSFRGKFRSLFPRFNTSACFRSQLLKWMIPHSF